MKETEFGYINWLQKHLKYGKEVVIGSGDDCAVVKLADGNFLYATTDIVVEGVDFRISGASPEQIGHKSVAISLSDLAAMGGGFTKIYALISASLPKKRTKPSFTHPLFKGMHSVCKRFGVQIIGGDISSTQGPVTLTSTLLGVSKSKPVVRSGARVGDAIMVTGKLGGSILGRHLSFTPRLRESAVLNRHYKINSMIDISDGLLADLSHILEASNSGAILDEVSIPISRDAYKLKGSPLQRAMTDGEDFELLFTASLKETVRIINDRALKTPIHIIGMITKQKGLYLISRQGQINRIKPEGYSHF
ncbi:MAG: thiamine-phosphate kinase [Planctomycetes bacterium]|nr:thiamine-phosphate kinase [Planctomycetota bacterium]